MCNVRDLGPYFVFGAWQHFMTAKETQQESGQRGRQGERESDRVRERGHLRPLTLPKAAKGMRKNAQNSQAERDRWRHRQDRGGKETGCRGMVERGTWTSGGLEQSNSQTAAEMYNKSRRQRATSTKNATLRIRSGAPPKKPNNRTKPRTLHRIPSPLPSTAFFSLSNPLSLRGLSLSAHSMLNGF